jgi:hypothetical protein
MGTNKTKQTNDLPSQIDDEKVMARDIYIKN